MSGGYSTALQGGPGAAGMRHSAAFSLRSNSFSMLLRIKLQNGIDTHQQGGDYARGYRGAFLR